MADKVFKTKGVVLKTVKYGETSLIVTIYTELFGWQTYMVNGVRAVSKKGNSKANIYQPTALLDLDVYYNEFKQINRIKEAKWQHLYEHILTNVLKNGIAVYMVELMTKCLRQQEANENMFAFIEDSFIHLDKSDHTVLANFPIFFALHLSGFLGFTPRIEDNSILEDSGMVFDMQEGIFTIEVPSHNFYIEQKMAVILSEILKVMQPEELATIELNGAIRRKILEAIEMYYSLHIAEFGKMKTVPILQEILR